MSNLKIKFKSKNNEILDPSSYFVNGDGKVFYRANDGHLHFTKNIEFHLVRDTNKDNGDVA